LHTKTITTEKVEKVAKVATKEETKVVVTKAAVKAAAEMSNR
jgi:hypothetical protein